MKQKLPHVEELTVKYALNELEPTEAKLLDAAMREDQDLLIEAESQRRTWERLRELPLIDAPAGLLEDTVRMAVAARRRPQPTFFRLAPAWRWAAAASVLLLAGWPLLNSSDAPTAPTAEVRGTASEAAASTEPWVDNQDVIRLQDATAKTDSAGRLVPIDPQNPSVSGASPRQVQQTSTQRTP